MPGGGVDEAARHEAEAKRELDDEGRMLLGDKMDLDAERTDERREVDIEAGMLVQGGGLSSASSSEFQEASPVTSLFPYLTWTHLTYGQPL